jgi:hypothetical protein
VNPRDLLVVQAHRDELGQAAAFSDHPERSIARTVGADPGPLIQEYDATWRAPETISAADAFEPLTPVMRERRRLSWTAALGLALAAILGFGAYHLAFGGGHAPHVIPAAGRAAHGTGRHRTSLPGPASTRAPRSAEPARTTPVRALNPMSGAAFGPGGTSQGDNPSLRRWRSTAARRRPGTATDTTARGLATCRLAQACSWTWGAR